MDLAKKTTGSGRLPTRSFDVQRTRFNAVHAWAMARLEEEALRSAVQSLDPKTYAPPRTDTLDARPFAAPSAPEKPSSPGPPYLFPNDGEWPFTQKVPLNCSRTAGCCAQRTASRGGSEVSARRWSDVVNATDGDGVLVTIRPQQDEPRTASPEISPMG